MCLYTRTHTLCNSRLEDRQAPHESPVDPAADLGAIVRTTRSFANFRLPCLPSPVPLPQFSKLQGKVEAAESRVSVLETMIDDLQWDIDKIRKREQRLNRHLADVLERVSIEALGPSARAGRGWNTGLAIGGEMEEAGTILISRKLSGRFTHTSDFQVNIPSCC